MRSAIYLGGEPVKIGIIMIAAVLIFAVFRALKTHFNCPNCGCQFKAPVLEYIFTLHFLNKRMVTCPKCGHTDLMAPRWDEKR